MTTGELVCSTCRHSQPDGRYCEACGAQLASDSVRTSLSPAHETAPSPSPRRFVSDPRGLLIFIGALAVMALLGFTGHFTLAMLALFLGLGYVFLVRKWLRQTKGIPGARWIGAGMLALLIAVVFFFAWLFDPEESPAYVFVTALCLAVIFFVAAWNTREHAKRVEREVQLLAHVEKLQSSASGSSAPAPLASPALTSNLSDLVAMLDRGLLTPEEFEVAKRRLLASDSPGGNDGA